MLVLIFGQYLKKDLEESQNWVGLTQYNYKMKVENMKSNSGRSVANQFIIYTRNGKTFQSYNSIIAIKTYDGKTLLDSNYWNYSNTTGKYRNIFLNETKEQTRKKIESGEYCLTNLQNFEY